VKKIMREGEENFGRVNGNLREGEIKKKLR
jgi:hypothetical protein